MKKLAIIILSSLLISCGFYPVHSSKNQKIIGDELSEVKLDYNFSDLDLAEKIILKEVIHELAKNFPYEGNNPRYILEISNSSESEGAVDMDRDGNITEYKYSIKILARLYSKSSSEQCSDECKSIVLSQNFSESLNYNVTKSYYASQVAKKTFRKDLAKKMASNIKQEIILNLLEQK